MIPAGRLNRQATLKRPPATKDSLGLKKLKPSDYTTVTTFRCSMESNGSVETEYRDGVVLVNAWSISCRAASVDGILPTDHIVIEGRTLAIRGIRDEGGEGIMLEIDCEEVIP